MDLNPQRKIADNLGAELAGGRTVKEVIVERFGQVEPNELRTKHGVPDELGDELDGLARQFIAGHGR